MIAEVPQQTEEEQPPVVVLLQQAIALYRQGQIPAAEALFCRILVDDPGNPHALHIMGLICHQRGDLEMAEKLIERSIRMAPHSRAYHNLGVVQQHRGEIDAAVATYRTAIALEPDYVEARENLIFALDLHPYATPEMLLAERRAYNAACAAPITALADPHPNDRDPDRRLRVGYVSPDFRHHSASNSFRWIQAHSPEQVEVYLYSTAEGHDAESVAFRDRADVWCEVAALGPLELAGVIRSDAIDILVDLGGFAKGGRLQMFSCKPAPVQITGWGYATGTGLDAMDYVIGDAVAVPPEHEGRYHERVMRLPSMLAYQPEGAYPDIAEPPERKNGYRTYGYLGRPIKLHQPTLALWAEILRRDPTSRLLLKSGQYQDRGMRERVTNALSALGIDLGRIEIQGVTSRYEHLEAHNEVDVCLDPFPQGGGMGIGDALLMGVPTVTLLGENIPGRVGASMLDATGWDGWVAETPAKYVEIAKTTDTDRAFVRKTLLSSILWDRERYARSVEAAYRSAWKEWVAA